jgi:hypothetical protein
MRSPFHFPRPLDRLLVLPKPWGNRRTPHLLHFHKSHNLSWGWPRKGGEKPRVLHIPDLPTDRILERAPSLTPEATARPNSHTISIRLIRRRTGDVWLRLLNPVADLRFKLIWLGLRTSSSFLNASSTDPVLIRVLNPRVTVRDRAANFYI